METLCLTTTINTQQAQMEWQLQVSFLASFAGRSELSSAQLV
jgi:hypothetical protein